ncbi:TPA: hypothetical protein U9B35_001917 [Streptococcus agalactiae]|nr:hypothetical protein [Streptococcus agalactiae]HEO3369664.1 hypothetical protein [Streptococcus agalactiae]
MFKWIKENIIMVIVIVLLLVFAGFGIFSKFKESTHKPPRTERVSENTKNKDSSSDKEETADEKNYRTAKLKLEHPYTESSEEQKQQVLKAFDEAINDIKKAGHLSKVKGTIENHLSMSQSGMVSTFVMALLVNEYDYQSSKLEVMPSENEDVVQFLIVLTKPGKDNCYFVGNFNTTVNQIQLKAYVGGNIGGTFG